SDLAESLVTQTMTSSRAATQILWCEGASVSPARSDASSGMLAPDLMREAVDRLAIVCLAYAGVYAVSFAAATFLGMVPFNRRHDWHPGLGDVEICAASVLLSLAFWAWLRKGRQSAQSLLILSAVYEALGALGIEIGRFQNWGIGLYDGISWSCVWILFFSVVVPMPRHKALFAALVSASMGPVAYALTIALGVVQPKQDGLASTL